MPKTLAIMITMTTYGTWLRGDMRGWVERGGRVLPSNPPLEAADRERMKHPVFLFDESRLLDVGTAIGKSLRERLNLRILAMAVGLSLRWCELCGAGWPETHRRRCSNGR